MKKIGGKFKTPVFYIPKMQRQGVVPGAPSMNFLTGEGLTPPGQGAQQFPGWRPPYKSFSQEVDAFSKYTNTPRPIDSLPLPDKLGPDDSWNDKRPELGEPDVRPQRGMPDYSFLPMMGMAAGSAMEQEALTGRPDMGMGIAGGVLSGASQGAMMGGPFGALAGAAVGAGRSAIQTGLARQNYDMAKQQEYENMIKQNTISGGMYQTGGEVRGSFFPVTEEQEKPKLHPYLVAYMKQAFENAAPSFKPPVFSKPDYPEPDYPRPVEDTGEIVADADSYINRTPVSPVERIRSIGIKPFPIPRPETTSVPIPPPRRRIPPTLSSVDIRELYKELSDKNAREMLGSLMMKNGGSVPKYQTDGTVTPRVDSSGTPVYTIEDVLRMDSMLRAKQNATATNEAAQEILTYQPDSTLAEYETPSRIPREPGDIPWGKAILGTAGAVGLGLLAWKSPKLWKKIKGGLKKEKVKEVEDIFKFDDTKALPEGKNYDTFVKAKNIIGDKAWHELEPMEIFELQALDPNQFSDDYIRTVRKTSFDEYINYTFGRSDVKGAKSTGPGWSSYKRKIRNSGVRASDPDYVNIPEKIENWMNSVDKKTFQPPPLTKREKELFRYNVIYRKGMTEEQKAAILKSIERARTTYPTVPYDAPDVPGTQNIPRQAPAEHYRKQRVEQEVRERIGDYYTNAYEREIPDQYSRLVYESTA